MDQKDMILQKSMALFFRCGIKSVTMDDVARELAISKKTLYKFVNDKTDLVKQVMTVNLEQDQCVFEELFTSGLNAIDELFEVTKVINEKLTDFHPSIHYDLNKYYPEAWALYTQHKLEFIYQCMVRNMENGIKEGLYRDNLNVSVIARIYITRMEDMFNPEVFPPDLYEFNTVYLELMRYHIRGIASEKGIKYLSKKIETMKTNLL
ncbi:MAG: TetR/AcrR family transcriptional regulator [Flavobacteriales bacterium]|nr:TetR/AcrR family transcriptional regulator [Flavobacteriales bacterium]